MKKNEDPKLRLKKKYLDQMEAENLSIEEFFEKRHREKEESKRIAIAEYLLNNPIPPALTETIDIPKNRENLGFEKRFFNRSDAEFLFQQIADWEEEHSLLEIEPHPEDEKESILQTYEETGIIYHFKNIGITVYSVWLFYQTNYSDESTLLNYGNSCYLYNHFNNEFRDIEKEDFHNILSNFSVF
ncbi:hypothetical protein [Sphingobacterium pedocola]|uniref:GTP-binding protein n=1 Tax=Sphingobacterium pedocola TaxID=2082722 RepID=A0ABR9T6Z2_9SPHI|nr:hypothetical protein [Sphingobacterium pedocola]MBE8720669.1 hypothetical protein [Sphingobacterium pedocola]